MILHLLLLYYYKCKSEMSLQCFDAVSWVTEKASDL